MDNMFFKIEKRIQPPLLVRAINPIAFILLAMAFCAIFIGASGVNPVTGYIKMIRAAFFTSQGLTQTVLYSIPLMLCGLGVSLSFRMNLNNLGAEGQYAMGAIAAGGFALYGPEMPVVIKLILVIAIGVAAGALWALVAAIPKALWGTSETIVSLMLNYVCLLLLDYLCRGPWQNNEGLNLPYSASISESLYFPNLFGTGINSGFIIAVVIAVAFYLFFRKTTSGYQISVIKNSLPAAKYAGMNIKKNILLVMGISGALAGLAGVVKVMGITHRLQPELPGGAGFTGIVIAYLSKFNPFLVIIVSFFFGGLNTGSYTVQILGVPSQIATMIQGTILVFVLAGEFFVRNKIVLRKRAALEAVEETEKELAEGGDDR
jgi:simple sugar transport system permease protein